MLRLLLLLALTTACGPRGGASPPASVADGPVLGAAALAALTAAYAEVGAALTRSDLDAAVAALRGAAAINPGDASLEYTAASVLAAAGRAEEALAALERLDAQGSPLVPQAREFPGVAADRLAALQQAARARLPASPSARAFTLAERDLIPEGIAHDPASATFFVGSIYKRKVVAVGADGAPRDLIASAADGLYSPLGLRFDARRGSLWVASAATPEMQGFDAARDRGRAALHEHDAVTGRLRARYLRDEGGPHLLNDLVIGARGEVYVSDSEAGEVLLLTPGPGATFEAIVPAGALTYPNGVAISDDGTTLFVADFVHGVSAVRLADRERRTLSHPRGATTHGFDGLYFHRGALIGVDNGAGAGRIVRMILAPALDRVVRVEVLEAGHPAFDIPTTGVLVGDALVYIANSQLRSFAGGKIFPAEQLRPIEVLRLALPSP